MEFGSRAEVPQEAYGNLVAAEFGKFGNSAAAEFRKGRLNVSFWGELWGPIYSLLSGKGWTVTIDWFSHKLRGRRPLKKGRVLVVKSLIILQWLQSHRY